MNFAALDAENTLFITASRRQSRFIREQYAEQQLATNKDVWPSLKVMPWQAFINYCWELALESGVELPARLGAEQSKYLWQQMVSDSEATETLLNTKQTQHLSYDAWRICQQWQIDNLSVMPGDQDQEIFADWLQQFQKRLKNSQWIEPHQQANELIAKVSCFIEQLPSKIITYGFEQPTPQQLRLLEQLAEHKTLEQWSLKPNDKVLVQLYSLAEPVDELLAAVRWAKKRLNQDPEQSIAIVVPDLEQKRGYIERLIYREFYAQNLEQGKDVAQPLHDFTIDEPLTSQPLVSVVMDWLTLFHGSLSKTQLQHLLLSPYLYPDQDLHWKASAFELIIRKATKQYYTLDELLKLSRYHQTELPWLKVIEEQRATPLQSKQFKDHIKLVIDVLAKLHWTGYHSLSSREFQVQKTFIDAIKSTESLQKVLSKNMAFASSIKLLKEQIEQQNFHQQQPKAPLQIMGMLEAIGVTHDAVWLVGATDQVLPRKATPNPFLSKTLHQQYRLPGSSHSREVDYAKSLLKSLLANPQLVISYAQYDGEQEQMMSPLLSLLLPQYTFEKLSLDSELPAGFKALDTSDSIEYYTDDLGLAVESHFAVKGGTGLLRMQAASPFDAYLRYRLDLQPFEQDGLGVSFMERGNLFHKVMQIIWQRLNSQQNLLQLSSEEQKGLVSKTVNFVLSEVARHLPLLQNDAFYSIEKSRLEALVSESLELDKTREPFTVVGTEVPRKIELSGLTFSIIIDRIDELEDGRHLIIDYKTGQPTLISLLKDPIAEPQLLLYAISEDELQQNVVGVVFMQAHLKACKYIGVTDESDILKGVKALSDIAYNPYANRFDEAIKQWKAMLESIAQDFKQGNAELTEYSGNFTEHLAVSRWAERHLELKDSILGGANND